MNMGVLRERKSSLQRPFPLLSVHLLKVKLLGTRGTRAAASDRFIFEDTRGEQLEGPLADIAIKYAIADKNLTMGGFKRTNVFGGSYPEFNL